MKQLAIAAILLLMTVFCAAACSGSEVPAVSAASEISDTSEVSNASEGSGETGPESGPLEQTEYIGAVPESYFESSAQPGKVLEIRYESRDYTSEDESAIQKTAYVYLPYGYDEEDLDTRYDILYLMHGWTMTAGDFFQDPESGIAGPYD